MKVTRCLTYLTGGRFEVEDERFVKIEFKSDESYPYSDMGGVIRWTCWYTGNVDLPNKDAHVWVYIDDLPDALVKLKEVVSTADLEVIKQSLTNAHKTINFECTKLKEMDDKLKDAIGQIEVMV